MFLALCTGCIGCSRLWNPDYGGQRDWDLFSLAIPATLLLARVAALRPGHWRRQR